MRFYFTTYSFYNSGPFVREYSLMLKTCNSVAISHAIQGDADSNETITLINDASTPTKYSQVVQQLQMYGSQVLTFQYEYFNIWQTLFENSSSFLRPKSDQFIVCSA